MTDPADRGRRRRRQLIAVGAIGVTLALYAGHMAAESKLPVLVAAPTILRDVSYVLMLPRDPAIAQRQSLDLYLPAAPAKPPLLAFVHGGNWIYPDDIDGVGPTLARVFVQQGVAVALIRYRLAPTYRFPDNVEDVARAVAFLHRSAAQYGYDPKRIYLAGHSAGAHLASLAALDSKYFRAVNLPAKALAGVVVFSGVYDLTAAGPLASQPAEAIEAVFGRGAAVRISASPITHARAGVPMLVLSAQDDFPGFQSDARRFAARLRAAGLAQVQEILMPKVDHMSIVDMQGERNYVRDLVFDFMGVKPLPALTRELLRARRVWQEPPFSTQAFWVQRNAIRDYPVDARFRAALQRVYEDNEFELKIYPRKTFHALDLFQFLGSQPSAKIGAGDYLTLTNVRGEKQFWKRSQIEAYQPVIVVGLDDERNMFRLTVFYRNRLEYSWRTETPKISARSVGAFIYFLKPPPAQLQPPTTAMYALTGDSFRLSTNDPLAAMQDLPREVYDTMAYKNACFSCHSFRGTDVRAGHLVALTHERQGGFALALESYAPEVWRQFMFDNEKSSAAIGVRSNAVEGPALRGLYDLVVTERGRGETRPR